MKGKKFIRRKKVLLEKRGNFPTLWDSCAKHILPDRAEFLTSRTIGDENVSIFDTAAIDANFVLAGWLWSQMTNPSTKWFKCRVKNKGKRELWEVKNWFREANEIMYDSFAFSNFYDEMHKLYLSMGAVGTAPMFMRYTTAPFELIFKEFTCRDALISENNKSIIDTMYRPFTWTVRQMVLEWGSDACSEDVRKLISDEKWDEKVALLHVVEPRSNRDKESLRSDEMEYASIYLEEKSEHVLEVSGYKLFPYVVGRFYKWGDSAYARSPGMLALPDIRTADDQDKTNLRAGHKSVEPALNIPYDMKGRVRTTPNALNHMGKSGSKIEAIEGGLRGLPHAKDALEYRRQRIEDKFFKRIILMLDSSGNTYKNIPEIMAREQEKMAVIGAPVGRLMDQVLGPIIKWAFLAHLESGQFPEPPEVLLGEDLNIEYTSPLAMAQRQIEGETISRAFEMSAPMLQIDPANADLINSDKYIRKFFDIYGADEVLNSPEEVAAMREQRAIQQQMLQQQQDGMQTVDQIKSLAQADQATGNKVSGALEEALQ